MGERSRPSSSSYARAPDLALPGDLGDEQAERGLSSFRAPSPHSLLALTSRCYFWGQGMAWGLGS